MYSYQGAPVHNPGYFDVPICNQYSNKNIRDPNQNLTEYQLNTKVNLTITKKKRSAIFLVNL